MRVTLIRGVKKLQDFVDFVYGWSPNRSSLCPRESDESKGASTLSLPLRLSVSLPRLLTQGGRRI